MNEHSYPWFHRHGLSQILFWAISTEINLCWLILKYISAFVLWNQAIEWLLNLIQTACLLLMLICYEKLSELLIFKQFNVFLWTEHEKVSPYYLLMNLLMLSTNVSPYYILMKMYNLNAIVNRFGQKRLLNA